MAISGEQTDGFANNWTYLKSELQWLERILMLAVARQRKDTREVDRLSQTKADRITSHWWKGIIALDGNISYDEHRQPQAIANVAKFTYQQQLEAQIKASQRQGIVLALPVLRDRLHLKEFEKNLILMALAPEVNRRYAQLYRFLQGDSASKSDLPTLDLILRLLCRTDSEWHSVRHYLLTVSPLLKTGLVQLLPAVEQTRLSSPVKLSDGLLNYLLADPPLPTDLEVLLQAAKQPPIAPAANPIAFSRCLYLRREPKSCAWTDLILPPDRLASLQYWVQQVSGAPQAAEVWHGSGLGQSGRFLLLAGKSGTGKTTAAAAIATALNVPLFTADLTQIDPADYAAILQEISLHRPAVVLIKSAQSWLSRSSSLPPARIQQWFEERSNFAAITCFSVIHTASVQLQFQRQMDAMLTLPLPNAIDRLQLWQRAFPPQVAVSEQMPWKAIANQLPINGGTIQQIVRDTVCYAAAMGASTVEINHLQTVCQQRGYALKLPVKSRRSKTSNRQRPPKS